MTDMTVRQQMAIAVQEFDAANDAVRKILLDMKFVNRDAHEWKAAAERVAEAVALVFKIKDTNAEVAGVEVWQA